MGRVTPQQSPAGAAPRWWGWHVVACMAAPVLGAAVQLQQPALWSMPVNLAVLALGVLLLVASAMRKWVLLAVIALALLAFASTALRAQARLTDALPADLIGVDVEVTGTVAVMPRVLSDGVRFVFDVEDATRAGRPVAVPPRISLGWYRGLHEDMLLREASTPLRAGQRWQFTVRLKPPHGLMNPHGFDFELWAFEQGLRASGYVRAQAATPAMLLRESSGYPVERWRQRVRDAIQSHVHDERSAGLLAALAIGDQAAIDRIDWEVYRNTGIAHLVSISGLHVTMFAWLAAAVVGALWRRSAWAMHRLPSIQAARWGGLVCAAAYALLAGWGVPAQRTVWMLATTVLLQSIGLRWPGAMVLLAAGVVVSAVDPWALLQPGFWLSFGAVGLLLLAEPRRERIEAAPGWIARGRAVVAQGVRTQVVASLGLAPLSMLLFQQVSVVGFVANLFAIPVVTLVITPLALLGALFAPLWQAAAWLVQALTPGLAWMASLPWATWSAPAAPAWAQIAALLAAVVLIAPWPWRLRALAAPLAAPLFAMPAVLPPVGHFTLTLPDIGQGGAALVQTAHHTLLYDAGPQYSRDSDAGSRVVVPLLRSLGVRSIDLLMLSHRDTDHVGGALSVMNAFPVRALASSLDAAHGLLQLGQVHEPCAAGQRWHWDGVQFEVMHPPPEAGDRASSKPNALSCVLRVQSTDGRSVLLTGDIEAAQEAMLVATHGPKLKSDMLVLAHHGSKTSSSDSWLDMVAPSVAAAQVGWRNRFGHPAPQVRERLLARAIPLVRSDHCGAWRWSSQPQAPKHAHCERKANIRYWRHHPEP
jgi:competence protein ComEC